MAFVFGLQTLWLKDFSKIYRLNGLKLKYNSHTNFYECCDMTKKVYLIFIHLKNNNNSTYVHNKNSNNNNNIGAFFWRRGEKRATVIASVLELGSTSYYLLCIVYLLFPQQFEWLVSSATTSILSTFSNGNFDLNWKMFSVN